MRHHGRTRPSPSPSNPRAPPLATKTWAIEDPASCGDARDDLVRFRDLAPDHLLELALDAVRMFEADLTGNLGDHVGVDAVVAIAQLDVEATPDLGMRFHDTADPCGELGIAGGHVLAWDDLRLHWLQVDVDAHHLRQLGAN